jgi:hypothetical protein
MESTMKARLGWVGGVLVLLGAGTALALEHSTDGKSPSPVATGREPELSSIQGSLISPSGHLSLPVVRTVASSRLIGADLPTSPFGSAADPAATLRLQECPTYSAILQTNTDRDREFYLSRGAYSGRGRSGWATDFEKADRQFLVVLRRLMPIDAYPCENPVLLDDPNLRRFPFLFMVEVGSMGLTPGEVEGLRSYLLAGGFVLIDDFWGTQEWNNFAYEMSRVLPEYEIVEVPMDHSIFNVVYPVEEVLQVPSINRAQSGIYSEGDGIIPHMRGIFDEKGRLMMAISWNSDLIDAWEWAEHPDYPWDRSNYAFQVGFNLIVYSMTH